MNGLTICWLSETRIPSIHRLLGVVVRRGAKKRALQKDHFNRTAYSIFKFSAARPVMPAVRVNGIENPYFDI